ncbi:hypothetical protein Barb4_03339 [Bacteroidales bacterium Barb4]|nr:hypothetical protein Barb4_03339 [Bacteroidales bacterium Barb4]
MYLRQQSLRNSRIRLVKCQPVEKRLCLRNGKPYQTADVLSPHLHIQSLRSQPRPLAGRADRLPPIAGKKHAILYLILIFLHKPEEGIYPVKTPPPVPQQLLLRKTKLSVGRMNRKLILPAARNKLLLPFRHRISFPAKHGTLIQGQILVWHNQILIYANHLAEALTRRASPERIVEIKHHIRRLLEKNTVRLKRLGIFFHHSTLPFGKNPHRAHPLPLKKSRLGRISQTAPKGLVAAYRQTVYQQLNARCAGQRLVLQRLRNAVNRLIERNTGIAFLLEYLKLLPHRPPFGKDDRCTNNKPRPFGKSRRLANNIIHLMLLHLLAGNGRHRLPHTGEKQADILIYFCGSAHRRTRIARVRLLLDGNSGRNALDIIHLRLAHPAQKLTGIRGKTLHIPPLPLGIKRIKSQRRLPAARQPRNNRQTVTRNLHIYMFKIINPPPLDINTVLFHHTGYLFIFGSSKP